MDYTGGVDRIQRGVGFGQSAPGSVHASAFSFIHFIMGVIIHSNNCGFSSSDTSFTPFQDIQKKVSSIQASRL
jgi:hypothetical protein